MRCIKDLDVPAFNFSCDLGYHLHPHLLSTSHSFTCGYSSSLPHLVGIAFITLNSFCTYTGWQIIAEDSPANARQMQSRGPHDRKSKSGEHFFEAVASCPFADIYTIREQ